MQYIDLSVAINNDTPVWPGDEPFKIESIATVTRDGCAMHSVSIGTTHAGTHIDAPSHMLEGGRNLDEYPAEQFVGHGKLIKVEKDITLELVKAADIQPDDIVLFWTGMSDNYSDPKYFEEYPAIPEEVAAYLVECKAKMVGVDTSSVDHEEFVSHRLLLSHDILVVENLANLKTLEGKDFTVFALPIKLQIDGAPARVIAEIKG